MPRAEVIALFGPTGVGKTDVAIELARRLRERGERPVAVSADALQVYQGLETLRGAATASERAQLDHRLISFLPVDATFSAGQYAELAHAEIDGLLAAGERPIVVGGTGLYLRAALAELSLRPPPPQGAREYWVAELDRRARRRSTASCASARRGRQRRSTQPTANESFERSSCSTPGSSIVTPRIPSFGPAPCATARCSSGSCSSASSCTRRSMRAWTRWSRPAHRPRSAVLTPRARRRLPARHSASMSCWLVTSSR